MFFWLLSSERVSAFGNLKRSSPLHFFYVLASRNVSIKTEKMTKIAREGKAETSLMSASTYMFRQSYPNVTASSFYITVDTCTALYRVTGWPHRSFVLLLFFCVHHMSGNPFLQIEHLKCSCIQMNFKCFWITGIVFRIDHIARSARLDDSNKQYHCGEENIGRAGGS